MNRIVVYRYQFNPSSNLNMAEALSGICPSENHVSIHHTDFGFVTNILTEAAPEQVFQRLLTADIGSHFTIVELDENAAPKITYSSSGINIEVTESDGEDVELDHALIDENMTAEQLQAELNMYLEKVQNEGLIGLNSAQKSRLEHLSQL